jgi:hypothetical protein
MEWNAIQEITFYAANKSAEFGTGRDILLGRLRRNLMRRKNCCSFDQGVEALFFATIYARVSPIWKGRLRGVA